MDVIELTDVNFYDIVSLDTRPIFVTFYAIPMHKRNTLIEDTVKKHLNKFSNSIRFAQVNVDKNVEKTEKFSIYAIPSFLILSNDCQILESFTFLTNNYNHFEEIFKYKIEKSLRGKSNQKNKIINDLNPQ